MGTTAEKLTYLNDTKQLLKENINNIGGNLTTEPFREYASALENIYERLPKVSGIGASLSLSPSMIGKIKLNEIQGNTYQNGTPTPSSPVPIQSVTGLQNVNVCGKNLLDLSKCINGYINASGGIGTGNDNLLSDYIKVESGTSYTISLNTQFQNIGYALFDSNKTYISRQNNNNKTTLTIIIPSGTSYIRVWFTLTGGTALTPTNILQYEPMIEQGSTATEYEPYKDNTYEVNLGDIELNKIGDYEDRIYKDNGKWYVEKNIGKLVLNGSESGWTYNDTNQVFVVPDLVNYLRSEFVPYSNYYQGQSVTLYNQVENNHIAFLQNTTQNKLLIKNLNYTGVSAFKTWLSNNNVEVLYQLATPTYTEITNTELIEDLETLNNAKSKNDTTNINVTSNDLSMILNVGVLKG